jgi:hypothetical protein
MASNEEQQYLASQRLNIETNALVRVDRYV